MADSSDDLGGTNRRVLLAGAGAAGLLGLTGALAACGSGNDSGSAGSDQSRSPASPSTDASTGDGSGDSGDDNAIAKTSDIPVGGGKIFDSDNVVVTQPQAGTFKAFSATCTHQNCLVGSVSNGLINCPCHGSQYSISDGSVVTAARGSNKDSQRPLPEKTVTQSGDSLSVG